MRAGASAEDTNLQVLLLKQLNHVKGKVSGSSRTLVLHTFYAFNAPTPNDYSPHSLLAALPLLSETTKRTREKYCCQTDFLFKTWQEKKLGPKKKRKRRTIVLVWCSHRVPGEPCVRLSVWEHGAAFQMYSLLRNSPPRCQWGQADKAPLSYFLVEKSQDPYNSDTFCLNTSPFDSWLDWNWKI